MLSVDFILLFFIYVLCTIDFRSKAALPVHNFKFICLICMGQSFSKGGGIWQIRTRGVVMIARSFNCWAIISIFFRVSVYLWLFSQFRDQNFLLVKKVGLVCIMSYLFYIIKSFVPLRYYLFLVLLLFLTFIILNFYWYCLGKVVSCAYAVIRLVTLFYVPLYGVVLKYCIYCI